MGIRDEAAGQSLTPESLSLNPFDSAPYVLDRPILHAQLDAGRAMEPAPKGFHQQFRQRRAELQHLSLVRWRLALRDHEREDSRRLSNFQVDFLATSIPEETVW